MDHRKLSIIVCQDLIDPLKNHKQRDRWLQLLVLGHGCFGTLHCPGFIRCRHRGPQETPVTCLPWLLRNYQRSRSPDSWGRLAAWMPRFLHTVGVPEATSNEIDG